MADIDTSRPDWMLEVSPKRIGKYSDEEIYNLITKIPWAIRYMANPAPELVEVAVLLNYQVIILIEQPSIELQRKVLSKWPEALAVINNLDETIALEMIATDHSLINLIKVPSPMMLSVAKIIS